MSVHLFLSPGWIVAVREIRDEYAHHADQIDIEIAANVTITDAPFDDAVVRGHVDTTGESFVIDEGHVDHAHFGVEMPYDIAHQVFIERDPATLMTIVLSGRVKLSGDSSRVLMLAGAAAPPDPDAENAGIAREILRRIDEITHLDPDA